MALNQGDSIPELKVTPDDGLTKRYAEASGDPAANEELAKRRAFAVRDALKAAGIEEARVLLEKPQVTAGNVAGEDPKARRVEVAMK